MHTPDRPTGGIEIQSTWLRHRTNTMHGPHVFEGLVSRGWGSRIDSWALAMNANANVGRIDFHLGIDESSRDFRRLFESAHNIDRAGTYKFLRKAAKGQFPEEQQPLPRTTERVIAEVLLQHMITIGQPENSLLNDPSIARLAVRVAAEHVPSLQTNEFVAVQNKALKPVAFAS